MADHVPHPLVSLAMLLFHGALTCPDDPILARPGVRAAAVGLAQAGNATGRGIADLAGPAQHTARWLAHLVLTYLESLMSPAVTVAWAQVTAAGVLGLSPDQQTALFASAELVAGAALLAHDIYVDMGCPDTSPAMGLQNEDCVAVERLMATVVLPPAPSAAKPPVGTSPPYQPPPPTRNEHH